MDSQIHRSQYAHPNSDMNHIEKSLKQKSGWAKPEQAYPQDYDEQDININDNYNIADD